MIKRLENSEICDSKKIKISVASVDVENSAVSAVVLGHPELSSPRS